MFVNSGMWFKQFYVPVVEMRYGSLRFDLILFNTHIENANPFCFLWGGIEYNTLKLLLLECYVILHYYYGAQIYL